MLSKLKRKLILIFTVFNVICCIGQADDHSFNGPDIQKLIGANGIFRGHQWGDKMDQVKSTEVASLTVSTDSILLYEIVFDKQTSIEMVYVFGLNRTLIRIESATIFENGHQELRFQEVAVEYYKNKLGQPNNEKNGIWVWKSPQNYQVELIALRDQAGFATEIIYKPL